MLVQAWADALLGRRLEDDRDIRATRQLVVVRSPVLAVGSPVGAINSERCHRSGQPVSAESAATQEAENDDNQNNDDDDDDEKPHPAIV